jgi:serine/threonine-protein kinase
MAGNVWEWMDNWYDEDKSVASVRGGSWVSTDVYLRCSARSGDNPDLRNGDVGFRVVRPSPFS